MNHVVLVGRLTKNPEVRVIPGSSNIVANFTLAVDRDYIKKDGSKDTDFIPVEVGGKIAENCNKYLEKGKLVAVEGSIRINQYTDKNDNYRTFTKVNARSVQFLSYSNNKNNVTEGVFEPSNLDPNGFQAIDDDEIPF